MTERASGELTDSHLPSVFEQIADSLRSGIAHARGEVVLLTTFVPQTQE